MPRFTALFRVELPQHFLMHSAPVADGGHHQSRDPQIADYAFDVGAYAVRLSLDIGGDSATQFPTGAPTWVCQLSELRVYVTAEERDPFPLAADSTVGEDPMARFTELLRWTARYAKVARVACDRLIAYFRHVKGNPALVSAAELDGQDFSNAAWLDDQGAVIDDRVRAIQGAGLSPLSWYRPVSGHVGALERGDEALLHGVLSHGLEVPLHRELAAFAKDAWWSDNLRRSVLELAVACEVAIKHAFFAPRSAASAAFEFIESGGRLRMRVLDLLKAPSEEAFGEGFATSCGPHFALLEDLFRCRNSVVHRGVAEFRDQHGERHRALWEHFDGWWRASEALFDWLERTASLPGVRPVRPGQ